MNEIKTFDEGLKTIRKRRYSVLMSQKIINTPQHQEILQTKVDFTISLEGHTGMMIPDEDSENSTLLRLSTSVVTVRKDNTVSVLAINLNDHLITFNKNERFAVFHFLSSPEGEELNEIDQNFWHLTKRK